MRKIRKFVLQGSTRLTRGEMSKIEGMDLNLVDVCTTEGTSCIYSVGYSSDGRATITTGSCRRRTQTTASGNVDVYYVCE